MAKKSKKHQTARYEKEYPGCMGGLIGIFNFRDGHSTRRLISDRKRASSRHPIGAGHPKSGINSLANEDKKHSGKDVTDSHLYEINEDKTAKVESDRASVKALIDGEMSKVQLSMKQIPRDEAQEIPPYLECRCHAGNNHKKTRKACNIASNTNLHDSGASASFEPKPSYPPSIMERSSLMEQEMHLNQTTGIDPFPPRRSSTYINMRQLQKHVVKEKLNEATESFLNQKLEDAKRLIRDGATHQSKEFMDALELLNSNKELFLRLLQDPNSLLVKHIEELRKSQKMSKEEKGNSTQAEKPINQGKFRKQNVHNFFRRKDKAEDRSKVSDSSFASNRIVVLKPSPESSSQNSATTRSLSSAQRSDYILRKEIESERVTTNFSIREITRKLKKAIGESRKERHQIPMDGILNRIPYGHQDSTEIGKRIAAKKQSRVETESVLHGSDHCINSNITAIRHSQKRGSIVYKEGKPAEFQSVDDAHKHLLGRRVPRTTSGPLSLPEDIRSLKFGPGRDSEWTSEISQMRFFPPYKNFQFRNGNTWQQFKEEMTAESSSPWRLTSETDSCTDCSNKDGEPFQVPSSNPELLNDHLSDSEMHMSTGSSQKGCNLMFQEADVYMEESLGEPYESDRDAATVDNNAATNEVEEEESFEPSRMDSFVMPLPTSTLSSFAGSPLLIHTIKVQSINEKPERPSPVSVLEPIFTEGVSSPASPQQGELAVELQPIHREEHEKSALGVTTLDSKISPRTCTEGKKDEFEYVRIVMEASGLNYNEFIGGWCSVDQPLPPSLFDQVESSCAHLSSDRKLLFDCMNEVLVEIYERFCSPWVSIVTTKIRPVPVRKHAIQEVWQGIDWHFLPRCQHTLDQIIGKDMAKAGSWMDPHFDVEAVGNEMGETILEKIMEEMILELWD